MARIKLTADAIVKHLRQRQVNATNKTLEEAKQYAIGISPTDTGEYISSRRIVPAQYKGKERVAGRIVNDSEHAIFIER